MKRLTLFLFLAVLFPLSFFACKDDPGLTDPTEAIDPSMGKYDGPQDVGALRVTRLIEALYPNGGLENSALNRWNNIQRQMARGEVNAAQSQMMNLADQVTRFAEDGVLLDPDDSALPSTMEGAVVELVTRLFVFVDLEISDALDQFPESMPEDFGYGTIDPLADDTIVISTENNWAAVVATPDAVEDSVVVTIALLDQETCDEASLLTQAMGCWELTRYPNEDKEFGEDVAVEMCVADNPDMTDVEWDLLLVHQKDDAGVITALPWAEPGNIDCTGFAVDGEPDLVASLTSTQSPWQVLGQGLAGFLLPEPLGASFKSFQRPPRGVGGLTGSFSEFFAAVPESAKPDLITWWTGDGNFLDMYGANPGAPQGDSAFVPGISSQAFSFDGDGDAVLITPLSEEVKNLQDLTLATWVNLDPASPSGAIQRFVTLGDGKAVLRQESGGNRMLHFFMEFEGLGLQHIWVNNAFSTGCYHFFAGTYDGQDMRAYLDGIEVGTLPVSGGLVAVASDWAKLGAAGGSGLPGAEALNGSLDEVMIFSRALTGPEIAEMHQWGGPARCQPASAANSVFGFADGTIEVGETAQITLQARDESGNDILGGGAFVGFSPVHGALTGRVNIGPVSDNGNGTYTASVGGVASGLPVTIKATVDGEEVTTGDAVITIDPAVLTAEQAEALIGGSFHDWWRANHHWNGVAPMLSVAADEHTSSWRNFGMEQASTEPRQAWDNTPEFPYEYASLNPWLYLYRSLLSTRDALIAIEGGLEIGPGGATERAVAFAKFVQGLSLGTLALVYDQAFVLDEDTDLTTETTMVSYDQVMLAALAKLDEAIVWANANSFSTDPTWMNGTTISNADMAAISHSYKARFMAQVARTPVERAAVLWSLVATEAAAGITTDFSVMGGPGWRDALKSYASGGSGTSSSYGVWGRLDVRYLGPADTNGNYQEWLALPLEARNEIPIETPDRRITGPTWDSDGSYVKHLGPSNFRPDRGTYHFSYYGDKRYDAFVDGGQTGEMVEMTTAEMDYLWAEAMLRAADSAGALAIINSTRTVNGLLPALTLIGPTGTDCVPRKDNGSCGDLWDALVYEKRLEVYHTGLGIAFFDDRGWGDLVDDTFHHLPVPGQELEILGIPYYTFGGDTWPSMVAVQAAGALGPVTVAPEKLQSYWQGLRSRLIALEEEMGVGGTTIIQR